MKKERQLESLGEDSKIKTKNPGSFALLNPVNLPLPISNPKPDLKVYRDAHQALPPMDVPSTAGIGRGRVLHVRSQEGRLVFDEKLVWGVVCFEVCVCIHA